MGVILELARDRQKIVQLEAKITKLEKALIKLKSCGIISIYEMSSILLDKLEEIGDEHAEFYLADEDCKIYCKSDVVEFLELDETDKIVYIPEEMDCDDFAAELYGKNVPLLWTNKHALSWFIDENSTLWFVEPQTDKISHNLDNWQGWDVRFFLNR